MSWSAVLIEPRKHRILKTVVLDEKKINTGRDVKEQIYMETGLKVDSQTLFYCSKELSDDQKVSSDYKGPFYVVIDNRKKIQIFVRLLNDKHVVMDVRITDTVLSIKTKLEKLCKIPVESQRLIHSSKNMHNNDLLSNYDIQELTTLCLTLDLKGS
jgi:hypothetical protein